MATETIGAARWLYSVLTQDSDLASHVGGRVFAYRVPEGSAFPAVVFQLQGAQPDTRVGRFRVLSRLMLIVKAVGRDSDFAGLRPIASRIDELLQGQSGSNVDGVVAMCVRDNPIEYLETGETGQDYAHLGGIYRFTVTA